MVGVKGKRIPRPGRFEPWKQVHAQQDLLDRFIELRSAGGPLAGRSVIFRVDTDDPAKGGMPVLYAPIQVSTVQV